MGGDLVASLKPTKSNFGHFIKVESKYVLQNGVILPFKVHFYCVDLIFFFSVGNRIQDLIRKNTLVLRKIPSHLTSCYIKQWKNTSKMGSLCWD